MLSFDQLRYANQQRQKVWPGSTECDENFRTIELAEEMLECMGRVLGAIKKKMRADRGIAGTQKGLEDLADEFGDLMICADLTTEKFGIDLGAATKTKFNRTSRKYDIPAVINEKGNIAVA